MLDWFYPEVLGWKVGPILVTHMVFGKNRQKWVTVSKQTLWLKFGTVSTVYSLKVQILSLWVRCLWTRARPFMADVTKHCLPKITTKESLTDYKNTEKLYGIWLCI